MMILSVGQIQGGFLVEPGGSTADVTKHRDREGEREREREHEGQPAAGRLWMWSGGELETE